MQMRFEGVLSQWDDARGFGFITPSAGGEAMFAHVSAFPRMAQRPAIGLRVSFEIETRPDGKKRARQIRLTTPTGAAAGKLPSAHEARHRKRHHRIPVLLLLLCMMLASWAYQRYTSHATVVSDDDFAPVRQTLPPPTARNTPALEPAQAVYSCDGRTHCSQMRSCAEAKFFLDHCPNVKMDGNHDGIPCEQQWCTGPLDN